MSGERAMGEVVRNLEIAADEHRINSAEAQQMNEAYRHANKAPIETKRELQTCNEDLEVRNHQLQESLDKQHAVARNLRHILLNIDLPMVFLDADLKIRFLTPAIRLLFNVTAIDIGRPLSDVGVLADDLHLHADAVAARDTGVCSDKEIAALNGHWYIRRITPYRRGEEHSGGVVITFIDTSVQRQIAEDREAAKRSAELAVEAKALFLAAASHDLRQPLQTLKLLHGLLEESVENDQSRLFVKRMEDTLASMSSILDTVLDGNQIETGMARPKPVAAILVIEEEKGMRDLLSIGLEQVGHFVTATASAAEALSIVQSGKFAPDAILADVNLAEGMDGVTTIAELRRSLGCHIPALVLTGNISSQTFRKYAQHDILHLNKSTRLRDIIDATDDLLAHRSERRVVQKREPIRRCMDDDSDKLIELIDDDQGIRDSVESFFRGNGWSVVTYVSAEEYLSLYSGDRASCLMVDAHLPGMGGLELLRILKARGHRFPVIVITGHSDVRMAVKAIKQGAADFIERPISAQETQASVREAGGLSHGRHQRSQQQEEAQQILAHLTRRQHQILERIVAGQPNKIIAAEMDISQRTVENHRASIMRRTGSASFPALLRLVAWAEE
jgi:FixJ family two-component response regulator/PAS domain-containing protein